MIRIALLLLVVASGLVLTSSLRASADTQHPVRQGATPLDLVVGSDNRPLILYRNLNGSGAGLAVCNDPDCDGDSPDILRLPGVLNAGLRLDSQGRPVVMYLKDSDVKLLRCQDPQCSANVTTSLGTRNIGVFTLTADDRPVIAALDSASFQLSVLVCSDPDCAGAKTWTKADSVSRGDLNPEAIALDSAGRPVIAYYDGEHQVMKLLHCGDTGCTANNGIVQPDPAGRGGEYASLTLDAAGAPVVSYAAYQPGKGDREIKLLHCGDANCSKDNSIVSLGGGPAIRGYSNVVLGAGGAPVVSYLSIPDLHLMACGDANCATVKSVQTWSANATEDNALALDRQGKPVVAFFDKGLYVAHCATESCEAPQLPQTQPAPPSQVVGPQTGDGGLKAASDDP